LAAKKSVFEYIEVFYNRWRLHSKNGYVSPIGFESRLKVAVFVSGKVLTHQAVVACDLKIKKPNKRACLLGLMRVFHTITYCYYYIFTVKKQFV